MHELGASGQGPRGVAVFELARADLERGAGAGGDWRSGILAGLAALCHRTTEAEDIRFRLGDDPAWLVVSVSTGSAGSSFGGLRGEVERLLPRGAQDRLRVWIEAAGGRSQALGSDMEVEAVSASGRVRGTVSLPSVAEAEVVARSLRVVLDAGVADPSRSVSAVPILHAEDRERVVRRWNATDWTPPSREPLHRLFDAQARRTPGAPAVIDGEATWTFEDIHRSANRLAARLRAEGVTVGSAVGLLVPRSVEMVIGMLGVLGSGGAFVLLDVTHQPMSRLRRMCEISRPAIFLASRPSREAAESLGTAPILCIEDVIEAPGPGEAPQVEIRPEDAAYLVFTSGSTGEPKGVIGLHGGLTNRLLWVIERVPLSEDAICCQKAALGFIDCIAEVLTPLLTGRPLVIVPEEVARDPAPLVAFLARTGVTRVTTVSTLLQMVLTTVPDLRASLPRLREWICSGEELGAELCRRFFDGSDAALYNFYGPSEASAEVSTWRCLPRESPVPIGVPLGNTQLYVLDAAMQPVPPGVAGELYIGGVNVARGYLDDPEQTAARFLEDPFAGAPGARLYRTGDRARHRADGVLEYLGRLGRDVKIRGNRVALGDVESAVADLPEVAEAAVVGHDDHAGATRLVAHVVPAPGVTLELGALREALGRRVPGYMVPAFFLVMDSLPRTSSGKLERKQLPALSPDRVLGGLGARPARTATERAVAALFTEILGLPTRDLDDDFLRLGGDSLMAASLLARLSTEHGLEVTLRDFFAAPTVGALAERLSARGGPARALPAAPASRGNTTGDLPLTYAQERLWFLAELDGAAGYALSFAVRMEGALVVRHLAAAVQDLLERHSLLRAVFPSEGGAPVCRVGEASPLVIERVDLRGLPPGQAWGVVEAQGRSRGAALSDLARGPLVAATLFALGPASHGLVWTWHHIVGDGRSAEILVRDLAALYEARVTGRPPTLPALPLEYADHARWERAQAADPSHLRSAEIWTRRMAGTAAALELPTDHPRPAIRSDAGALEIFRVPQALHDALEALARETRSSLFMVAHAAFAVLLSRLTGQEDVCVGTPAANRRRGEVSEIVGLFVNTLVLRVRTGEDPSFRALLGAVREDCLEAFDHQGFPFEQLVRILRPERDLGRTPLVQVSFALERPPLAARAGGVEMRATDLDSGKALFDLSVTLRPGSGGIEGVACYSRALFEPETVRRWMGHYLVLLEAAARRPDTAISRLPLSTATELRALVEAGVGSALPARDPWLPVHHLIELQARAHPGDIAVVAGEERLSYGALDRRANRLARELCARGVGPEILVAVCGPRSSDLIVAVLAVMKAGGAWLPLDPTLPPARLRFMVEDSGAALLLTHPDLLPRLGLGDLLPTVPLEHGSAGDDPAGDTEPVARRTSPGDLAYVIYTSGSTGRPKGVMITHASLESAWRAWDSAYELTGQCACHLQMASFSFDVFVGDFVRALCSGGRLVLAATETILDPPALLELMDAEGVDCADFAPPVMRILVEHLGAVGRDLSSLRVLVLGTDAWNVGEHRRWRELLAPGARFFNAYGVTEATVASSCHDDRRHSLPAAGPVPIGTALPGERLTLVDRHLVPVPLGVAGEICIGGAGVARGYRNREELTRERFVPDPFSGEPGRDGVDPKTPGARLYRTGDIGRLRADGVIEFLGRADRQVKIRGFRVEPGELEGLLARHPAIRRVAVLSLPDPRGGRRLRAAVVAHERGALTAGDVRSFAAAHVPDYMVPASVLLLDSLPTTPHGKIDVSALARLADPEERAPHRGGAPRIPEESLLAEILSDVLGVARVGVDDDFFELGGHSLLATQAVARIRDLLSVTLKVRAFFESPTVTGLAEQVKRLRSRGEAARPRALSRNGRAPGPGPGQPVEAPCSPAQLRLLFLHQMGDGGGSAIAYNIPALFRVRGPLDPGALAQALAAVVARHEVLRTTFVLPGGAGELGAAASQRVHDDLPIPLTVVTGPDEEDAWLRAVRAAAAAAAAEPFDLETGPLVRAVLFQHGSADGALLLHMHHIVSDAWSVGIFANELSASYRAALSGERPRLPPLRQQYRDFAAWQRELLATPLVEEQLGYWRRQLEGAPPLLELTADRPRPPTRSHRGGVLYHAIDADLTGALRSLGRRLHGSLYMILLAALGTLLFRRSGEEDLCIGSPIANRGDSAFEGLIGFFVNTLVIRLRLEGQPTFAALVARVREIALDAYDHQDVPFDLLVEALRPRRSLGHSPLFQVVFALQNVPTEDLALEGLSVTPLDLGNGTAKFDLVVIAEPRSDGLRLEVEYSADLFDAATVARMMHGYETLLRGAVADPGAPITRLPLVPPAELAELVGGWNATGADLGRPRCLHHVFEDQAARHPDEPALLAAGETGDASSLTFGQLDRAANALAHRLRDAGVGPDVTVGLHADRCPAQIIAILAILKAGGAYVPLDPVLPPARLQAMAAAAEVRLVLTGSALGSPSFGVPEISLDASAPEDPRALRPPETGVTPDHLVYVTYTSGSTGQPKGIAMPHAAVWNLVAWHAAEAEHPRLRTVQYAPLGFDVSFQEIFSTFFEGGTLILVTEADRRDPFRLWDLLLRRRAERLFLPTAALEPFAMAGVALPALPEGLREVWVGGEQMRVSSAIRQLFQRLPRCRLVNYYGPSECHAVTWAPLPGDPAGWDDTPHIGRPIANTRLYILDDQGAPVPIGVTGELCIAGVCVSRGYLGQPAQTAARFVADPFTATGGARMYRTGDRARFDAEGNIHFLGRRDDQIKVRGFRIELGEVESVLAQHPSVLAAAAGVLRHAELDARLVAWIVRADGVDGGEEVLRRHAGASLPEYMVPSVFTFLAAMPMTSNGKVDRKRLPAPEAGGPAKRGHEPPLDRSEAMVARVFADLVGAVPVGRHDDFFDLGGNSILAMSLVARIRAETGRPLSVADLFQGPTPALVAARLQRAASISARSLLVPVRARGRRPPFFCVHPAGGNVICYEALSRHLGDDQPFYALQSFGLEEGEAPLHRVEEMARAYLGAIAGVSGDQPIRLGGWSMGGVVAYEMARQALAAGGEVAALVLIDSDAPEPGGDGAPRAVSEQVAAAMADDLGGIFGRHLAVDEAALLRMNDDERTDHILQAARAADVVPPHLDAGGMRRLLRVFAANLEAMFAYAPPAYAGPLTVIAASDRRGERLPRPPHRGWAPLVSGPLSVHAVPGDHYTLLRSGGVEAVARILHSALSGKGPLAPAFSP